LRFSRRLAFLHRTSLAPVPRRGGFAVPRRQAGESVVDVIVEIKAGFVAGNLDIVTGDVERLSGRRPRPLRDVLSTALA